MSTAAISSQSRSVHGVTGFVSVSRYACGNEAEWGDCRGGSKESAAFEKPVEMIAARNVRGRCISIPFQCFS
jgi:hypothetical protein